MRNQILINFSGSKYSDAELMTKTDEITNLLKGNDGFPDAEDLLKDVVLANDDFKQAVGDYPLGGTLITVVKRNRRKVLEEKLKKLAEHIQVTSDGEEELILATGYEVRRRPSPIGKLPAPRHLSVKTGDVKCIIQLACTPVRGARYYEFEMTAMPVTETSIWKRHSATRCNITLSNLVSGREYAFRVAAAGTNPARTWSEVITSYVL